MKAMTITTVPGPEREELRFKEVVLRAFAFLEQLGFRCTEAGPTFVRFESSDVFINIYHGRASFEVGVEVGFLTFHPAAQGRGFVLDELLELGGVRTASGPPPAASTPESVAVVVPQVAELVHRHAVTALRADPAAFEHLASIRASRGAALMESIKVEDAREAARRAWQTNDYAGVIAAYGGIADHLTISEAGKLAYAKKRLEKQ
jgi:hypothetical protein